MDIASESLRRLRETALPRLRPGGGWTRVDARETGHARKIALALSRGSAAAVEYGADYTRRRLDAASAGAWVRREDWPNESMGERRGPESDAEFQGAWDGGRGLDGKASRRDQSCRPERRQRRRGA